jgi:hypothetical protein
MSVRKIDIKRLKSELAWLEREEARLQRIYGETRHGGSTRKANYNLADSLRRVVSELESDRLVIPRKLLVDIYEFTKVYSGSASIEKLNKRIAAELKGSENG